MSNVALQVMGARLQAGPANDPGFTLDVSAMSLHPGELCALVGPTGGGKSTLLEFLALLRQPTALDRMTVGACDVTEPVSSGDLGNLARMRAGPVGFVPQSGAVLPFLSAAGNAWMGVSLTGQSGDAKIRERFDRLVRTLGLSDDLAKKRAALSGGQRKRVSLLRGFSVKRDVLLLDEPTSGLDPEMAQTVVALAKELCRSEGTAGLAAMHDLPLADRFGLRRVCVRPTGQGRAVVEEAA